jgi:RNA polymerase sigma-70 factor (ECF subfamily)
VAAVWEAAAKLPERQRTVFLLRFVEDMDLLEIAYATGIKEGTVKAHLFRAMRAVRVRLGGVA